jgi:anti-sigma regulatory factor (Ser/Thr protein kinase)
MEALLIDEWMPDLDPIEVVDDASVSLARQRAREVATAQGLNATDVERLATIASELGTNQVRHAVRGLMAVRAITRGGCRGVEVAAADRGAGIADPAKALLGVPRDKGSLGVGLAAAREHAFEVDFDVRIGEGTLVRARLFEADPPRRRQIGVLGRPIKGERSSGDHAGFVHLDDGFAVAVCDGLGHGSPARAASSLAIHAFYKDPLVAPTEVLAAAHRELAGTRGAVMAVARVREVHGSIETATVGNVIVQLVAPRSARRFGGSSFVLGSHGTRTGQPADAATLEPDETLVLFTDGIASRATIEDDLALLREHPIVIAQRMIERYGTESDDTLVLVARAT